MQNYLLEVGNGRKVRFWEDVWFGEAPLCSSLKRLALKGLKWRSFGKSQGQKEGGTSDLRDNLMIGS